MTEDPISPVKNLIATFGGSFPSTGQGLVNVIHQLEASSTLPPALAAHASRWAVRTIGAFIPAFDGQPIELVKFCGIGHVSIQHAVSMVECMGYWENETDPRKLRAFLIDITQGVHPEQAAEHLGISNDELTAIEYLLEARQHWHNCVIDRVYMVRANGGGWWKTCRELGTFRPGIVRSWIRAYEHFAATGDYPQVEPLITIPDGLE